nr:hypothetical protein Iba_scaffold946CG0230 [Ipomoea batatas]
MFGFVLMEVFGSYNWGLRTGGGRAWCILSCGVVHYCESLVHYKSPWWIAVLQSVQWVFGVVHCCRVLGGSQYFRVCNGFLVLYIAVEFFAGSGSLTSPFSLFVSEFSLDSSSLILSKVQTPDSISLLLRFSYNHTLKSELSRLSVSTSHRVVVVDLVEASSQSRESMLIVEANRVEVLFAC